MLKVEKKEHYSTELSTKFGETNSFKDFVTELQTAYELDTHNLQELRIYLDIEKVVTINFRPNRSVGDFDININRIRSQSFWNNITNRTPEGIEALCEYFVKTLKPKLNKALKETLDSLANDNKLYRLVRYQLLSEVPEDKKVNIFKSYYGHNVRPEYFTVEDRELFISEFKNGNITLSEIVNLLSEDDILQIIELHSSEKSIAEFALKHKEVLTQMRTILKKRTNLSQEIFNKLFEYFRKLQETLPGFFTPREGESMVDVHTKFDSKPISMSFYKDILAAFFIKFSSELLTKVKKSDYLVLPSNLKIIFSPLGVDDTLDCSSIPIPFDFELDNKRVILDLTNMKLLNELVKSRVYTLLPENDFVMTEKTYKLFKALVEFHFASVTLTGDSNGNESDLAKSFRKMIEVSTVNDSPELQKDINLLANMNNLDIWGTLSSKGYIFHFE